MKQLSVAFLWHMTIDWDLKGTNESRYQRHSSSVQDCTVGPLTHIKLRGWCEASNLRVPHRSSVSEGKVLVICSLPYGTWHNAACLVSILKNLSDKMMSSEVEWVIHIPQCVLTQYMRQHGPQHGWDRKPDPLFPFWHSFLCITVSLLSPSPTVCPGSSLGFLQRRQSGLQNLKFQGPDFKLTAIPW